MVHTVTKEEVRRIKGSIIASNAPALGEDDVGEMADANALEQVIFGWIHLGDEHWKNVRETFERVLGEHHPKFKKG